MSDLDKINLVEEEVNEVRSALDLLTNELDSLEDRCKQISDMILSVGILLWQDEPLLAGDKIWDYLKCELGVNEFARLKCVHEETKPSDARS